VNNYLWVIPIAAALALGPILVWTWALHLRQQKRIEVLEGRVANMLAGLSLLTDTTEGGLRDVMAEMARLSGGQPANRSRSRATASRRINGAARRGQSIQQIAASEQISEGEVKLRLSMTGAAQDGTYAAMR
jgi:hypothetical protein